MGPAEYVEIEAAHSPAEPGRYELSKSTLRVGLACRLSGAGLVVVNTVGAPLRVMLSDEAAIAVLSGEAAKWIRLLPRQVTLRIRRPDIGAEREVDAGVPQLEEEIRRFITGLGAGDAPPFSDTEMTRMLLENLMERYRRTNEILVSRPEFRWHDEGERS